MESLEVDQDVLEFAANATIEVLEKYSKNFEDPFATQNLLQFFCHIAAIGVAGQITAPENNMHPEFDEEAAEYMARVFFSLFIYHAREMRSLNEEKNRGLT